ncbi:hypothetical protein ACFFX0_04760 [Citricoccus parietis]|uniref:Uncharacterized protein n=1 Tax=Citricoccus parietis TaxID=592307 RepID=A0ABV5FV29_9MICC
MFKTLNVCSKPRQGLRVTGGEAALRLVNQSITHPRSSPAGAGWHRACRRSPD